MGLILFRAVPRLIGIGCTRIYSQLHHLPHWSCHHDHHNRHDFLGYHYHLGHLGHHDDHALHPPWPLSLNSSRRGCTQICKILLIILILASNKIIIVNFELYTIYGDLYNHDDVDDYGNYIVAPAGPLVAGQLIAMHCSGPES